MKKIFLLVYLMILTFSVMAQIPPENRKLKVSANGRFLEYEDGKPFFWMGDTGWLLINKLTREEAEKYLNDRFEKGFNVIQAMIIHSLPAVNVYGDSAFVNNNPADPKTTAGAKPGDSTQCDFWDHIDFIIDKAAERGIYIALVPVWGSNVKNKKINITNAAIYAEWLAERYKYKPNIIWINGGDLRGDNNKDVWNVIGKTLHEKDSNHLITFHPFGRTQSSTWFHSESWLDFNMFQSGHRRYDQDKEGFGEDNWKYVEKDYAKIPAKPTLDGEPSYENIPQGLHDITQPYWKSCDVRRYAYWSVFAGACGFTYGNNAVMQMHKPNDKDSAYGVNEFWYNAVNDSGAGQMVYLKKLMLSHSYSDRIPDQSLLAEENGTKYDRLVATRGKNFLFVYTYNGRNIKIHLGKISGSKLKAYWYNPRNGISELIGTFENKGIKEFDPPGEKANGNDWVLIVNESKL
jgi:hypothetical protein